MEGLKEHDAQSKTSFQSLMVMPEGPHLSYTMIGRLRGRRDSLQSRCRCQAAAVRLYCSCKQCILIVPMLIMAIDALDQNSYHSATDRVGTPKL